MIFIRDLGTRPIGKDSHMTRYGVYQCIECGREYERQVRKREENIPCKSCQTSKQMTVHGHATRKHKSSIYRVYQDMIGRCYNKNNNNYRKYGAKGVTVCDEWRNSFTSFEKWARHNGYKKGLTIDKDFLSYKLGIYPPIYSPKTCQFISQKENTGMASCRATGTHPNIKISDDDASEICEAYSTGMFLQNEIAEYLGVSQSLISYIVRNNGAKYMKGRR